MNISTRDRGFSLIEVVMALSIMSVACLSAFSALNASTRLSQSMREEANALRAAEAKLAEIRATPFDELADTYASHTFNVAIAVGFEGTMGIKVGDELQPEGEVVLVLSEAPVEGAYGRDMDGDGWPDGVDLDGNGVITQSPLTDGTSIFPLDLNGDGGTESQFQAEDIGKINLIPVVVVVRWRSSDNEEGRLQLVTLIGR